VGLRIATDALGSFDRLSLVARRPARAGLGGEHRSRRPSPSTDFVDYRPYQPGDDFRRVDWNVYGRLGSLQVKVTEGRERLDVLLVLDCSGSMAHTAPAAPAEKLEYAAQLVATLGYVALGRADAVRVVLLGTRQRLGPLRGRTRMAELVRFLARIAPAGRVDLEAELGPISRPAPGSGTQPLVIVVSDLLAADGISGAWDALLGTDVVVLHVVSPSELDPKLAGEVELVDAETGDILEIGASLETLNAYRARYADWLAEQQAGCEQRGMRYVRLRTDRAVPAVMLDDLRRAGVLK
jgi:uncharacterized protein (DUF58 family)